MPAQHAEYPAALRRCFATMPVEDWPEKYVQLVLDDATLEYHERFETACFLFGNGCTPRDIRILLAHKLRDAAAVRNLDFVLTKRLSDPSARAHLFHFDVRLGLWMHMNGEPTSMNSSFLRMLHSWDKFCACSPGYPTLRDQTLFFGQRAVVDAFVFFNVLNIPMPDE